MSTSSVQSLLSKREEERTTSSGNHSSPAPPERNCKRDCNVRKTDNVETADQSINRTLAEVTDYVQESALKLSSIVDGLDQTMSEPQNGSPKFATGVTEEVGHQLDKKEPEHSANPDSGSPTGQGLYVVENPEDCQLEQGLSQPFEVRKSGKEPAFELVKTIRDCDEKENFCPEDLAMSATGGKKAASIQGSNSCGNQHTFISGVVAGGPSSSGDTKAASIQGSSSSGFQHTSTISGVVAGGPSSGDKEASLAVGRAERLDLDLNLPVVEESPVYHDQQPEHVVDPAPIEHIVLPGEKVLLNLDLNLPAVEESFVYDDQQPEYGVDPTQNQELCGENAPVERGEGNAQSSGMAMKRGEPSDGFDLYPESSKRL